MAGMKRFIAYIYGYENAKKAGNTGFARIELRGEECRLEIHLRSVYAAQTHCRVYLFRKQGNQMEGSLIGEMEVRNGAGDFATAMKIMHIPTSSLSFFEMDGIFLRSEDGRIFMSRWTEGEPLTVDMEHFGEWRESQPEEPPVGEEVYTKEDLHKREDMHAGKNMHAGEDMHAREDMHAGKDMHAKEILHETEKIISETENKPAAGKMSVQDSMKKQQENRTQITRSAQEYESELAATELPARNFFPQYQWKDIWEQFLKSHPANTPFSEKNITCIKIELKDIRELPKKYWYLGNNSFLLHGFFNYRYLVLGKIEEDVQSRWFLGVPGIYQNQERVMAIIFGFPEFMPEQVENRFGCWYRFFEE